MPPRIVAPCARHRVAEGGIVEKTYEVGAHVVFVDAHRKPHQALVTEWFTPSVAFGPGPSGNYGANVVYVSGDPERDDTYGRQIERETSVVHKSYQPAGGVFWCWPDEV